jgi:hypothetical protein
MRSGLSAFRVRIRISVLMPIRNLISILLPIRNLISILLPIWIRIFYFDADPDPNFYFDAIRIRISILMPIRIRISIFDADSDPNFYFDIVSDLDRHQNDADPQTDPTPSLAHVENSETFFFLNFIHSSTSLQCFSFAISAKILSILDSIFKFSKKKVVFA